MKTPLAAIFLLACGALAGAQQQADHSKSLSQNATQAEVRSWISLQPIEAAVEAATQHMNLNPDLLRFIRICAISGKSLDQLLVKHPELMDESDALYAKDEPKERRVVADLAKFGVQPQQAQMLKDLIVKFSLFNEIMEAHPALKTEMNALFSQHAAYIDQ